MTPIKLLRDIPTNEVAQTLRTIADGIDAGNPDWPVSSAVLVLGHTESRPDGEDEVARWYQRTHGLGPRNDVFTVRGLLATALRQFGDD